MILAHRCADCGSIDLNHEDSERIYNPKICGLTRDEVAEGNPPEPIPTWDSKAGAAVTTVNAPASHLAGLSHKTCGCARCQDLYDDTKGSAA